eukprot:TRINITY_DN3386_c0_g2_i1.p1 TRINITY_DN3386_c0_g2~~TRINITY_DN3386_c0_g2_i1.p1  ORF type:complete len:620 (+),score=99.53 TRINITY_DN3386_c0_g2_i1:46-1905(+)
MTAHAAQVPLALLAAEKAEQLATSDAFIRSAGPSNAERLQLRACATQQALNNPSGFGLVSAIGNLVLDCITLPDRVAVEETSNAGDDGQHQAWMFGPGIAEAIAAGLAALSSLAGTPCDSQDFDNSDSELQRALEVVGAELDQLAPQLFGSLCRSEGQTSVCYTPDSDEQRLEVALRSICAWALIAVGRSLGYDRLSASVLWEWSSADALWVLVLAKGALLLQPAAGDPLSDPPDLREMRGAVLNAVLGLASPDVAFADATSGNDVSIALRTSHLCIHRAQLAVCFAESNLFELLAREMLNAELSLQIRLLELLVALTQPECMAEDPTWSDESYDTLCSLQSVREASSELVTTLSSASCAQAIVELVLSVGAQAGAVPSVLRTYASFAFAAPSIMVSCVGHLVRFCLTSCSNSGLAIPFATLCVLVSNARIRPASKDKDDGGLWHSLVHSSLDERLGAIEHLKCWDLPARRAMLIQWLALLSLTAIPSNPPQEAEPPPPEEDHSPVAASPAPAAQPNCAAPSDVRTLLRDAPADLRCAMDGRLLVDPVRSPAGHVFERATLAAALRENGGRCPLTGTPLALEACPRDGDLRMRSLRWVRECRASRPAAARRRGGAGAAA